LFNLASEIDISEFDEPVLDDVPGASVGGDLRRGRDFHRAMTGKAGCLGDEGHRLGGRNPADLIHKAII
jgi:hypothetical protein